MIQQIILGLGLLAGCLWCLVNPFAGVITLMGVNMVQPGELYPVFNAIHTERMVALLLLLMMFAKGYRFVFPQISRWMLYFYGACIASIPLAFWISNSIASTEDFGKTILISLILVSVINSRQRLRTVLIVFSLLVGYLSITSLVQYFAGNFIYTMHMDRIAGLTNASNTPDALGLTICTALPFMYLFTRKDSSQGLRLLMWADIALSLWTMLFTGSRGAFLSLILILGLAVLISRRRMFLIPAVTVLCLLIWVVLPQQYKARYITLSDGNATSTASYTNRLLSWQGGWHMFQHNPITGIGVGNYTSANGGIYFPGGRHVYINAHSLYFKVLGELGLLGVITFGGFVTVLLRTNNRVRHHLKLLETRAARGEPEAQAVPEWLRLMPLAVILAVIALLYCGYAYHDLYRSTWYFLAGITGALDLMIGKELAATEAALAAAGASTTPPVAPARERAWA